MVRSISIGCFTILLFFSWLIKEIKSLIWFERFQQPKEKKITNNDLSPHLKYSGYFVIFSYWAFVSFFTLMLLLLVASRLGTNVAKDQYDLFKSDKKRLITVEHKENGDLSAQTIVCSSTHCAFFIDKEVKILPLTDIITITSKPK